MKISAQTILEAALPVFNEQGIRATTLNEVARASGIRVQELKVHFHSKKVLVSAFVDYVLNRHAAYLKVNPLLSPNAITELQNFFQFVERLASEFTPTMLFELKRYNKGIWNKLTGFKDYRLVPYLQKNLKRGVAEGYYRDDIDQNLYTAIYFNLLLVVVTELKDRDDKNRRLLPEFHKIFLGGMLTTRAVRM